MIAKPERPPFAEAAYGVSELCSPDPTNDQSLSSRREEPTNKVGPDDVLCSVDTERKLPAEPATGFGRPTALWPVVWLALIGVVTLGWLIGIGWTVIELIRWLTD